MGNTSSIDSEQSPEQSCACGVRREKPATTPAARHHRVLDELMISERRYVADMEMLVDVFYLPLIRWVEKQDSTKAKEAQVSRSDIEKIFSNVGELIAFSRRLLPALERARAARSKAMLVVLLQLATSFKVYDVFVANYVGALDCLARIESSSPVSMFIRACELQERCRGLGLRDFLLMPLERVAQYRQLVESTAENCPPHLAALQNELAESLRIPLDVSNQILRYQMDSGDKKEVTTEVVEASVMRVSGAASQPPSRKIREGELTKICQDGPKMLHFVLSPEKLSYSSPKILGRGERMAKRVNERAGSIPLGRCFVIDGFATPLEASFVVASDNDSFLAEAKDVAEKDDWVTALKNAMYEAATVVGPLQPSSSTVSDARRLGRSDSRPRRSRESNGKKAGESSGECTNERNDGMPPKPLKDRGREKKGDGMGAWKRKKRATFSEAYRTSMAPTTAGHRGRVERAGSRIAGREQGRLPMEECSIWVACGPNRKAVQKVSLRLNNSSFSASSEDAWNGRVGFRRALADPECYASFRELLRSRHASENLDFLEAVEHFRLMFRPEDVSEQGSGDKVGPFLSLPERGYEITPVSAPGVAARKIVRRFVEQEAQEQVNLSSKARERIIRRQAGRPPACPPPEDLFDEAWDEVSTLLQRDAFVPFRNREVFVQLRRRWTQKLNGVLSAANVILASDGARRARDGLASLALLDPEATPSRSGNATSTSDSNPAPPTRSPQATADPLSQVEKETRSPRAVRIRRLNSLQNLPPPPPPATPATPWTGAKFSADGEAVSAASPATMAISAAHSVVGAAASFIQVDNPEARVLLTSPPKPSICTILPVGNQSQVPMPNQPRERRHSLQESVHATSVPRRTENATAASKSPPEIKPQSHSWKPPQRRTRGSLPKKKSSVVSVLSPKTAMQPVRLASTAVKESKAKVTAARAVGRAVGATRQIMKRDLAAHIPTLHSSRRDPLRGDRDLQAKLSGSEDSPPASPPFPPPLAPPKLMVRGLPSGNQQIADGDHRTCNVVPADPELDAQSFRTAVNQAGNPQHATDSSHPTKSTTERTQLSIKDMAPRSGGGDELDRGSVVTGDRDRGERRDYGMSAAVAEKSDDASPRFAHPDNHQVMLRTSPGMCLGVHIANEEGMATVYAFRELREGTANPVEQAGLRVGDVLVSVNGLDVLGDFQQAVKLMKCGQQNGELSLVVRRSSFARYGQM